MDKRGSADNPPHREKSDEQPYANVKNGFRFKSTTDPAAENRPRFSQGLKIQIPPVRQPDNPPVQESLQRVMGFAKFLKTHTSPQDKRVTAGGRIVPVGPKSPPPTFQVEHLDTVLRTAEKSQRQLEATSELASEQKVFRQQYVLSEPQNGKSISPATDESNDSDEDQHHQFGWLKLDKSFRLIEQLTLGTAIVKLGASKFFASTKGPNERVHFQTVTVQQPQPLQVAPDVSLQYPSSITANTLKLLPEERAFDSTGSRIFVPPQVGDAQFRPMFPHHDYAAASGFMLPTSSQTPTILPLGDFGNLLPGLNMNAGHHHEWTKSSSTQAKHSDDLLNNRYSAIPTNTWSIETLSALRDATDDYTKACFHLKDHEKYTALNEAKMTPEELQFAIEKKRYLILAREACRQAKNSLETRQSEQLQRLRELETQYLDHWQTQPVAHVTYDGASMQNPSQTFGGSHFATASEKDHALNSVGQKHTHAKIPAGQNQKSLSPRAPEFFPATMSARPTPEHQDEKLQTVSLPIVQGSKPGNRMVKDESKALILYPREETVTGPHNFSANEVRQALQTPSKGPMQVEQEISQLPAEHRGNNPDDPEESKRTRFYLAAQARRSEQPARRSKLSARGSISELACRSLADFASQQTGVGMSPKTGGIKSSTHGLSASKDLNLSGCGTHGGSRSNSQSIRDEDMSLPKRTKTHVRFGIDECIAAFEASSRRADAAQGGDHRPISSSESGADQLPMLRFGRSYTAALRELDATHIRDNNVDAEVEERIRQEQQKTRWLRNERKGINLGVSSPSTHLAPDFDGNHAYSSPGAKSTTGQGVANPSSGNRFPATPSKGAAKFLRSTLHMDARLRGGLGDYSSVADGLDADTPKAHTPRANGLGAGGFGPGGDNSMAWLYGDMDQAHEVTTPTRLRFGPKASGTSHPSHMGHQLVGPPISIEPRLDDLGQTQAATQLSCHPSVAQHAKIQSVDMIQFRMVDPSLLPLDIYRDPFRPYTPVNGGQAHRSRFF